MKMTRFANADPLGVGLRYRAAERRLGGLAEGMPAAINSLPDPMWDAYFQSMEEQGVNKMGDNSVGVEKEMWDAPASAPPTFSPYGQSSAVSTKTPQINKEGALSGYDVQRRKSRALGSPNATLDGIYRVTR